MLIEFRVKNFRSLRDEQVLSMVASRDKRDTDTHTVETGISAAPRLLRAAVIYGANAAGKSNIIRALQYMRSVVIESAALPSGRTYNIQPFKFEGATAEQPTEFEITFLVGAVRYQYGFHMTSERITREYLLVYKTSKPQRWFDRTYDPQLKKDLYEYSPNLKGAKTLWEGATRPNALFLSMATHLNSESLVPVFHWFVTQLVIANEQSPIGIDFTRNMISNNGWGSKISSFLSSADIGIQDIHIETRKVPGHRIHIDKIVGKTEVLNEDLDEHKISFSHTTKNGHVVLDFMDESGGTRKLFALAGPVFDILSNGYTLIVDELDASMHTLLVRELVRLFYRHDLNNGRAQLIFSTHNTSLLDDDGLFRRDQIWFVDKNQDQASELYSLVEYHPRKKEALERGYLSGRYAGVPFIQQGLGFDD